MERALMRVDPFYVSNLVGSLGDVQLRQQQLSEELSSGMNMNSPSDNPVNAGQNVVLLDQIQRDDSFTTTANAASGRLQVADSALGSVVDQLTQAISLAMSANNGTMNSSNVQSVSLQIAGILSEVESLANSDYQGQYIFAGGQTGAQPFSTTAGTTNYSGDANANYLQLPNGQKIQLNVPGDRIFLSSGGKSVFGALNALVADYASGMVNTQQAEADTTALTNALNYVSQQRVTIDNSITQLANASSAVTNEKTQLITAQTDLIQADLPTVATQLSQAQAQQQALIGMIALLESSSNSLFSKL